MSNLGGWQWLAGDGVPAELTDGVPANLNGWVYTKGCWSWGMVITWRIEIHIGDYWWVGNFWCWNKHKEAWDVAQLESFKEDPEVTADWMVHHMMGLSSVPI